MSNLSDWWKASIRMNRFLQKRIYDSRFFCKVDFWIDSSIPDSWIVGTLVKTRWTPWTRYHWSRNDWLRTKPCRELRFPKYFRQELQRSCILLSSRSRTLRKPTLQKERSSKDCRLTKLLYELREDPGIAFNETPVAGSPTAAALAHIE